MQTPERDFEQIYQQAYYRHSGFGPSRGEGHETARRKPSQVTLGGSAQQLVFAGLALVMFVVPAVAAALVV